jgi:hypothetical protein
MFEETGLKLAVRESLSSGAGFVQRTSFRKRWPSMPEVYRIILTDLLANSKLKNRALLLILLLKQPLFLQYSLQNLYVLIITFIAK